MIKNSDTILLIPAYNEEACLAVLLEEVKKYVPALDMLVINDGSTDRTEQVVKQENVPCLTLPCNLGVGGAIQAGFQYAYESGYQYAVRIDGDGQHPPSEIPKLIEAMKLQDVDMVYGSRFLDVKSYRSTLLRSLGIRVLAKSLSIICRQTVTDPTSGFQMVNRKLLYFFSRVYPVDYPEPEALALIRRQGYDFMEVPTLFRQRLGGNSTIKGWGTLYYVLKVLLALIVDRVRPVNRNYSKNQLREGNDTVRT
jgi:glycosyltransferase involved in cell wall biosynthesis